MSGESESSITKVAMIGSIMVWNALWQQKSNDTSDNNYEQLNVLDTIIYSKPGGMITAYLFTTVDGLVKSKLPNKWFYNQILMRALSLNNKSEPESALFCDHYVESLNYWIRFSNKDELKSKFTLDISKSLQPHPLPTPTSLSNIQPNHITATNPSQSKNYSDNVCNNSSVNSPPNQSMSENDLHIHQSQPHDAIHQKPMERLQNNEYASSAIICYNYLKGTISYLDVVYEFPITAKKTSAKITVYTLCLSKSKGVLPNKDISNYQENIQIPSERILCHSKPLRALCTEFMNQMIKIIEVNKLKGIRVVKLSVMLLLESFNQYNSEMIIPNTIDSTNESNSRRLWLHHTNEISYCKLHQQSSLLNSSLSIHSGGKMSNFNAVGASLNGSSIYGSDLTMETVDILKLGRCSGDFCSYNPNDESAMNALNINGDFDDSNIQVEALKAIIRHRRVDSNELLTRSSTNNETEEDENDENFGNQTGSNESKLDEIQNNSSSRKNSNNLLPGFSQILANDSMTSTSNNNYNMSTKPLLPVKNKKVTMKSIVLARKEIEDFHSFIESDDVDIENNLDKLRNTSVAIWPNKLKKWWLADGRIAWSNSKVNSLANVPPSSSHKIGKTMLMNSSLVSDNSKSNSDNNHGLLSSLSSKYRQEKSMTPLTKLKNKVSSAAKQPLDSVSIDSVNTKPNDDIKKEELKMGQVSWYYSTVNVCECCYNVYKDLDSKRNNKLKKLTRLQREQQEQSELDQNYAREIEQKIFAQRKFVSRLATIKDNNSELELDGKEQNSSFLRQPAGAPKCALPPLPWNLTDEKQRNVYEKAGHTFAVRNILEKGLDARSIRNDHRLS
eukprot:gene7078-9662_t